MKVEVEGVKINGNDASEIVEEVKKCILMDSYESMQVSIDSTSLTDLEMFIEVPIQSILIEFLNMDLRMWTGQYSGCKYGINMKSNDYISYHLNGLIHEYLKTNSFDELNRFQSKLKKATHETFIYKTFTTTLSTSVNSIEYELMYGNNGAFESFTINTIDGYCILALARLAGSNIIIKNCDNCGRFFIPSSRSDEKYCDNIIKGNKTCKEIGYEQKALNDPFTKAYRTAYKTKNAYKQRYMKNSPGIRERFDSWTSRAKTKLDEARSGKINLEEFQAWLKDDI